MFSMNVYVGQTRVDTLWAISGLCTLRQGLGRALEMWETVNPQGFDQTPSGFTRRELLPEPGVKIGEPRLFRYAAGRDC